MSMPPAYWPPNGVFGESDRDADCQDARPRVDSPFDVRQRVLTSQLAVPEVPGSWSATVSASPSQGIAQRTLIGNEQDTPRRSSSRGTQGSNSGSNVRFFVVDHPEQLRNRAELRKNRQHVMHDYLTKAAANPSSNDPRAKGPGYGRKRKMSPPSMGTSGNPQAPSTIFRQPRSNQDAGDDQDQLRVSKDTAANAVQHTNKQKARKPQPSRGSNGNAPLVSGISGRFRNYGYLGTAPADVPFPLQGPSGVLNPFGWPSFDNPSVNVNELKWSCSRRFGSRGIGDYWVPTLLKARHAFLSTICISSAHDDIMRRSMKPPDQRPKNESIERGIVRSEVTSMINESLNDREMRTADATLIAVLHLLNAEIMGCDDSIMYVHQKGLQSMVEARGGLNSLGVNGQLALIITITMYLIAILREAQPAEVFSRFAERQQTRSLRESKLLPESPVYCRQDGYRTITKTLCPERQIYKLLDVTRQLTREFLSNEDEHGSNTGGSFSMLMRLRDEIFAFQAAEERDFKHLSERYTYEAVRLASRIFAHALEKRIPFSQSAYQLREGGAYCSLIPGYLSTEAKYMEGCAMHIHVRNALMRTDLTDCWGHMAGVLFWIGLVAGAAANPSAASEGYMMRRESGEDEEARKWLAAIVVRCSTVLGFEFGSSILETVKVLKRIQRLLEPCERTGVEDGGLVNEEILRLFGPACARSSEQHCFADYAWDFER